MAADPTEQVAELVRQYEARSNVSRTLSMLFRDQAQKELFLDVFTHHIDLLKSRSQAFEDAHVTVYDKALLTLTRYGNDNPGAFELYLDEIIGVPQHGRLASMESVLEKNVALKELLFKVLSPICYTPQSSPPKQNASSWQEFQAPQTQRQAVETSSSQVQHGKPTRLIDAPEHSHFTMLFRTYQQAKIDYLTTPDHKEREKVLAARFLRDTAENAITELQLVPDHDKAMMNDLKAVCARAQQTATALYGNRPRKFDDQGFTAGSQDGKSSNEDRIMPQGTMGRYDVERSDLRRPSRYDAGPRAQGTMTSYQGAAYEPKKRKRDIELTPYQRNGRMLDSYKPTPAHETYDYDYEYGYERIPERYPQGHRYEGSYGSRSDERSWKPTRGPATYQGYGW